MYKKIALVCATIATAGLLMTGCSRNWDTELRREVSEGLQKIPERSYIISEKDRVIITKPAGYLGDLKVTITNKITGDVLEMTDHGLYWGGFIVPEEGYFSGVDEVLYNGVRNGTEGMDEKFDEALRKVKPQLEERIKQEVQKVKENTKLGNN